jgi:hypothetical protein
MSDMETTQNLTLLFRQLGLPHDEISIEKFLKTHRGISRDLNLWEASFWSAAQSGFLRSAFEEDAEWARAFDELNARLR